MGLSHLKRLKSKINPHQHLARRGIPFGPEVTLFQSKIEILAFGQSLSRCSVLTIGATGAAIDRQLIGGIKQVENFHEWRDHEASQFEISMHREVHFGIIRLSGAVAKLSAEGAARIGGRIWLASAKTPDETRAPLPSL